MKFSKTTHIHQLTIRPIKWHLNLRRLLACLMTFILYLPAMSYAQITINVAQHFNFGTFYQGNTGGSIDINTSGSRSANGDIILLNGIASGAQAIFEVEAPTGSVISLLNMPDATLTGSNGGTLTLQMGKSDLNNPFVVTAISPGLTRIQLSGKLLIGDSKTSPPGNYQGTFAITFNQE